MFVGGYFGRKREEREKREIKKFEERRLAREFELERLRAQLRNKLNENEMKARNRINNLANVCYLSENHTAEVNEPVRDKGVANPEGLISVNICEEKYTIGTLMGCEKQLTVDRESFRNHTMAKIAGQLNGGKENMCKADVWKGMGDGLAMRLPLSEPREIHKSSLETDNRSSISSEFYFEMNLPGKRYRSTLYRLNLIKLYRRETELANLVIGNSSEGLMKDSEILYSEFEQGDASRDLSFVKKGKLGRKEQRGIVGHCTGFVEVVFLSFSHDELSEVCRMRYASWHVHYYKESCTRAIGDRPRHFEPWSRDEEQGLSWPHLLLISTPHRQNACVSTVFSGTHLKLASHKSVAFTAQTKKDVLHYKQNCITKCDVTKNKRHLMFHRTQLSCRTLTRNITWDDPGRHARQLGKDIDKSATDPEPDIRKRKRRN
ncbi:uncharacterized protein TNCV_1501491 [Trichonephila clavipes]|uniref:Uncharacterized protein n=1 Tax=Trichonephila clavipes TaxID=2585209 RepID=A0A8X6RW69_TRICX|nr:uncharacterized protein TNCV_1501491 [Trichonephila clavipes]